MCSRSCGENCKASDALRPFFSRYSKTCAARGNFVWSFVKDVRAFTGSLRAVGDERRFSTE
jgi:hypothetical protein